MTTHWFKHNCFKNVHVNTHCLDPTAHSEHKCIMVKFKAADISPSEVLAGWLHLSVYSEIHNVYVLPVVPAPSSGAPHDTHAAAGHVQEHPDTRTDTQYKLRLNNVIERLTLSFLFFFFLQFSDHTASIHTCIRLCWALTLIKLLFIRMTWHSW